MLSTATKPKRKVAAATRNPQRTRERLLEAAFHEVHRSGFRGADLDTVLGAAGVTKGALYHHFKNKEALGYAIVDEIIGGYMEEKWLRPLRSHQNPIDLMIAVLRAHCSPSVEDLRLGCPLNNLAQEMSPLDEGFRKRLGRLFRAWHDETANALREGQKRGVVRHDINPDATATFILGAYEGCWSLAKNAQDVKVLQAGTESMVSYLESLRALAPRA